MILRYNWITYLQPDLVSVNKKMRTSQIVDFAVPVDHKVKNKENRDKYQDLAREVKKKLWNIKVKVIPIVIEALGRISGGLVQGLEDVEIRGRVGNIQETA